MVQPPRRVQELRANIRIAQSTLENDLGREPTSAELAEHLDETVIHVEEAINASGCYRPISLDRPVAPFATTSIGDTLSHDDQELNAAEARVVLTPLMQRLRARDREIVRMRFYDDCTQREIADAIGVTQMQVSRLLRKILAAMREELESGGAVARAG
jgi:RNA polymerase sigma-B factor